jgi:hypothetical protein
MAASGHALHLVLHVVFPVHPQTYPTTLFKHVDIPKARRSAIPRCFPHVELRDSEAESFQYASRGEIRTQDRCAEACKTHRLENKFGYACCTLCGKAAAPSRTHHRVAENPQPVSVVQGSASSAGIRRLTTPTNTQVVRSNIAKTQPDPCLRSWRASATRLMADVWLKGHGSRDSHFATSQSLYKPWSAPASLGATGRRKSRGLCSGKPSPVIAAMLVPKSRSGRVIAHAVPRSSLHRLKCSTQTRHHYCRRLT